jgi:hypothetical protein
MDGAMTMFTVDTPDIIARLSRAIDYRDRLRW